MKFFTPFISLTKETHLDAPDKYFLHVLTFCDNASYVADGFSSEQSSADSLLVKLMIGRDNNIPPLFTIKPVTHTIALGELPFEEGDVEVELVVDGRKESSSRNRRRRTKASTSGAEEIDKPIGNDSVQDLWKITFGTEFSLAENP